MREQHVTANRGKSYVVTWDGDSVSSVHVVCVAYPSGKETRRRIWALGGQMGTVVCCVLRAARGGTQGSRSPREAET
jgi:hypothetical protein